MGETIIAIKNLFKSYYIGHVEIPALKNINIAVTKNQYLVIKGPSGSGKSTLMHLIGCLDRSDSGSYYFDGHLVEELSDLELSEIRGGKIGFVFQSFNLIPRLSIMKNVELPLFYLGISGGERSALARDALARVGLEHRLTHSPAELSGGEKQRAAIARAIVTNPSIVLADEPKGNLDSKTGEDILKIFDRIYRDGGTILIVTHNEMVAERGGRIVTVLDGEIVSDIEIIRTEKE